MEAETSEMVSDKEDVSSDNKKTSSSDPKDVSDPKESSAPKDKKKVKFSLKKINAPSSLLLSPLNSPISLDNYEHTLQEWKTRGGKIAFIYEYIIDKYRKKVDNYTLAAFLLISITSLLSLGNFGVNDALYPSVALGMKVATAVLTTSAAVVSGVVKIFGWSTLLSSCQKYLDSVENFVAMIISEQTLPLKFRTEPDQFILNQKDKYQSILNSAPDIPHDDYVIALEKYDESRSRLRYDLINV